MSEITIYPSMLQGELIAPPSKSVAHRAIICATVSQGDCLINNVKLSDDIEATINGMKAMGSKIEIIDNKLFVRRCVRNEEATINCRESGSTMRFLIPLAAAMGMTATFTGEGRLPERTIAIYENILNDKGLFIKSRGGYLPLEIKGRLKGGIVELRGDISSQFVSGLLMAAPLMEEGLEIVLTTELQSAPYVDITIDIMKKFGVSVERTDKGYKVPEDSTYESTDYTIEGDFSQASFWLVANALGSDITVKGLNENTVQGDREIIDIINRLREEDDVIINAMNIPDLVPIICVLAGLRKGKTTITDADRLRLKESDRLESTAAMLNVLGADYQLGFDGFVINGVEQYEGGTINSYNDHRIAMAAAIASTRCRQPVKILDCDSVNKSYPNFYDEFVRLGGKVK